MGKEEFCTLTLGLRDGLMALSRRFLGNDEEAEDNVQDTLLRLWQVREKLPAVRSVPALATAVCRNLCVSKLRSRRRIVPISIREEVRLTEEQGAEWMLEEKENAAWLAERIGELPAQQMLILRMSQQDELENSEIAAILGISETTVRTALCKARKRLLLQFKNQNY